MEVTVQHTITESLLLLLPVVFVYTVEVTVQHAIAEVLLSITDDLHSTSAEDYMLKVFGRAEYLLRSVD